MAVPRPFALVHTEDQWRRAAHQGTALEAETGAVHLARAPEPPAAAPAAEAPAGAGLAFDPWCRLYHSLPEAGRIEKVLWAAGRGPDGEPPAPLDLVAAAADPAPAPGEFAPAGAPPAPLAAPRGLAVDADGRLFVAESGAGRVLIFDLTERRLLARVPFARPGGGRLRPLDLATDGRRVWAALDGAPGLAELTARTGPVLRELPAGVEPPSRLAVAPEGGGLHLLLRAGTPAARIVPLERPAEAFDVPGATDLELTDGETLVVARRPGEDFLRFRLRPGARDELAPLKARGYDGRGTVVAPDGRIGFWTAHGFRLAVAARVRYLRSGRVITYRLDAGEFQTVWGRLFLDACIPRHTAVTVHCATADEPPEEATVPRTPPAGATFTLLRPDLSPPMPPLSLAADGGGFHPLHRRATGRELPWVPPAPPFETYEAPVLAPPGRYLWVTLELAGDTRVSPRVQSLRAEHPGHDLLRRLPRVYSRDGRAADFLRRYLAPLEGTLAELDARASFRRALLDPWSAPAELLPWLAGFAGLVLDERWPVAARRRLIAEAAWLFRFRGTVPGLTRFLAIVLGRSPVLGNGRSREPILIEHFRTRGVGGALVGEAGELGSQAVLGAGFRVGGAVGTRGEVAVLGTGSPGGAGPFARYAHRFTVVLPAALSAEELAMVEHVLEVHRPAHTLYDLCTVDAGMRAGVGLYVALTSVVGRTAGFNELQLGGTPLGRTALLGRPAAGTRPAGSRLGRDSHVG